MTSVRVDTSRLVGGLDRAAARVTNLAVDEPAAQLVLTRADTDVPRETGTLAASGHVTAVAGGAEVVYSARYAQAVHALNPWLARAADDQATAVLELYADAVATTLNQITT